MAGVGRPLQVTWPKPLSKQGLPGHIPQDCVLVAFEYVQERGLHKFSGQSVPRHGHLHSKEVLPLSIFSSRGQTVPAPSAFPVSEVLQSPNLLWSPPLDSLHASLVLKSSEVVSLLSKKFHNCLIICIFLCF